jgi:hypothetical protein
MRDSYPIWKEFYLEALLESDREKLTGLVATTEQAIAVRSHNDAYWRDLWLLAND